jgi:aryl-alcohol dehydrogenase-like predicted oxidoreductase
MVALRDAGKIAGIGVSNVSLDQVETAIELAGIVCVQNPFSLVDRTAEAILDRCGAEGITFVPYFPLGSAFPGLPKVVDHPPARTVAQRLGVTPQQVGLAWLLARAPNILLIPGTSSIAHLEENLAVGSIELRAEDITELEG